MAVPKNITFYKKNDQIIELSGLKDGLTGAYKASATVKATLKDSAGQSVTGITDLTMSYVSASSGIYRGIVTDAFDPQEGYNYLLIITAAESGADLRLEIPAFVVTRTE